MTDHSIEPCKLQESTSLGRRMGVGKSCTGAIILIEFRFLIWMVGQCIEEPMKDFKIRDILGVPWLSSG